MFMNNINGKFLYVHDMALDVLELQYHKRSKREVPDKWKNARDLYFIKYGVVSYKI